MSPHAPALSDAFAVDGARRACGAPRAVRRPGAVRTWPGDPELAQRSWPSSWSRSACRRVERVRGSTCARAGSTTACSCRCPSSTRTAAPASWSCRSRSCRSSAHRLSVGRAGRAAADSSGAASPSSPAATVSHRLTPDAPAGLLAARRRARRGNRARACEAGTSRRARRHRPGPDRGGGECGLRSFIALGGFAGDDPVPTRVLAYEGPWGVGYLTALVGETRSRCTTRSRRMPRTTRRRPQGRHGRRAADESEIVALARASDRELRPRRRVGSTPAPLDGRRAARRAPAPSSRCTARASCAAASARSLPTRDSLAEEVVANAIEAATRDPRFPPLGRRRARRPRHQGRRAARARVVHARAISTRALRRHRLERLAARAAPARPRGRRRRRDQVDIAMRKAGIAPGEPCSFERFKVDRYT